MYKSIFVIQLKGFVGRTEFEVQRWKEMPSQSKVKEVQKSIEVDHPNHIVTHLITAKEEFAAEEEITIEEDVFDEE